MTSRRSRRSKRSVPAIDDIVAPGGGTRRDVNELARNLGLNGDAVTAILNCQGSGLQAVNGDSESTNNPTAAAGASAWADFMSEEGFGTAGSESKTVSNSAGEKSSEIKSKPQDLSSKSSDISHRDQNDTEETKANKRARTDDSDDTSNDATATPNKMEKGERQYILPIPPRTRFCQGGDFDENSVDKFYRDGLLVTPGIMAQTGTLDSLTIGRKSCSWTSPEDLTEPTILTPSVLSSKVIFIATSCSSAHSLAINYEGHAFGWGRNENGQIVSPPSACVPLPIPLIVPGSSGKFVGGAVGKGHSVLIDDQGSAFAIGANHCGQCGVNSSVTQVPKWRKCVLFDGSKYKRNVDANTEEDKDAYEVDHIDDGDSVVQASCGENFTVLLTSLGHIYTCGLSEFGQLGNGETGEYFITASKLTFANASKFERRSIFVQSLADAQSSSQIILPEEKKSETLPLPDSQDIVISSISCGKNHTIAVEAPTKSSKHMPRVFTWGCGDYGCLGHSIQKDEYRPRLVSTFRGPIFQSNTPTRASAGAHCSLILTSNGHVYYWGKHKQAGEATMRPAVVDALANNGHTVVALGAGNMTVFCSTKNGVTVSWGNGPNGELGFGSAGAKSSSKPKFVDQLDSCLVTEVSCAYGHTLLLIRNEDEEDKSALKKLKTIEEKNLTEFVKIAIESKGENDLEDADNALEEVVDLKRKGKGRQKKKSS